MESHPIHPTQLLLGSALRVNPLAQTTDEMQRQQIVKLLAEEEAKEPPLKAASLR
jgi:hypothetical protein